MGILLRYACLLGLGGASLFTFVSASAVTGQRLAATSGHAMQNPIDSSFMVLAVIGVIGLLSVVNFVLRKFPSLVKNWFERRKGSITTMLLASVIWMVFLVT
jgi:flagellar biogenesis protein FliO